MSHLDAIALNRHVRERLVEFSLDDHFVRDPQVHEICRDIWSGPPAEGGLVNDLWVETAPPSQTVETTLDDLVAAGHFQASFRDHLHNRGAFPRNRQLYSHQYEAILEAGKTYSDGKRPSLVVTAGTGAGKTESFLLPILNELFARPAMGPGMRCLILYPLNALVNDQMERLYDWLQDQTRVRLFHFTSETPENSKTAQKINAPGADWQACRFRTRQQARGLESHDGKQVDVVKQARGPIPDIVVTNYSMLEYMLCRPQDAVFFGKGLRAIVLDEAHLYTATLAAEIALLLRRLFERCGVNSEQVLQIATSATLGTGAPGELELFASKLFTKDEKLIRVIRGKERPILLPDPIAPTKSPAAAEVADRAWSDRPALLRENDDHETLAADAEQCQRLTADLSLLVGEQVIEQANGTAASRPAVLLHEVLSRAPMVHALARILNQQRRLPLSELALLLWKSHDDSALKATTVLLRLAAIARQHASDYPLVPHRIHLLAHPADGLNVCLKAECSGPANHKLSGLGCVTSGLYDHCHYCNSVTLSLCRCVNCGEWALSAVRDDDRLRAVPPLSNQPVEHFTIQTPSRDAQRFQKENRVVVDTATGEEIFQPRATGAQLYSIHDCPVCETEAAEAWRTFASASPLALAIIAETAFAQLPEFPGQQNHWLPARGRRLLAFSDSRQEAARLGPRLTRQHETQLLRAAAIRALQPIDTEVLAYLRDEIELTKNRLAAPSLSGAMRIQLEKKLAGQQAESRKAEGGGSIADWVNTLTMSSSPSAAILHELLDPSSSRNHQARDWIVPHTQKAWEKNFQAIRDQLSIRLGRDLASPVRRYTSLETLGLLEVVYTGLEGMQPASEFLGSLPGDEAREKLTQVWPSFLAALCDTLRTDGVITLGDSQRDDEYPVGGARIGRWCAEERSRGSWLVRFVGEQERQRRHQFAQAVLQGCGLAAPAATARAADLLRLAFRRLHQASGQPLCWLQVEQRQSDQGPADALRIQFHQLSLRQPLVLYRCPRTGHIWPREVLGCAPEPGCTRLEKVTPEQLDQDPRIGRLRRELRNSPVFAIGLWAEEHTAQLSPQENRRLQDLFKSGIRNLLSSTTTLELGIDIGGLSAVLLGNVPPGRANYLQRAGRAGRRADGSSMVLTFIRPQPFDREVFRRFGDYLDRVPRRPRVLFDRHRVVSRHLHAYFLGEFFRVVYPADRRVGAMNAFGYMGRFCGRQTPPYWENGPKPTIAAFQADWSQARTESWWNEARTDAGLELRFLDFLRWVHDLGEKTHRPALERLLQQTPVLKELTEWKPILARAIKQFVRVIDEWCREYDQLLEAWSGVDEQDPNARRQANAMRYQLSALYETTVIESLADQQFLPRYGFPIGVQRLKVLVPDETRTGRSREEDQYRLERTGLLGLRDYVPGSQLLVGGRLLTSRGLLKHWTGANINNYLGIRGHYTECSNGHFHYWTVGPAHPSPACPICQGEARRSSQPLLQPRHGFSTAAWDPPRLSTDVERVGTVERATITFSQKPTEGETEIRRNNFGKVAGLQALYREDGELLVYNAGDNHLGFAICTACGYADSERELDQGTQRLPSGFATHPRLNDPNRSHHCSNPESPSAVLRNQTLAAFETTDVLMLDFTECLHERAANEQLIQTLARALQIAGASLLDLDTREIGVLVAPADRNTLGSVLYDNVPGGAGHVLELLELGRPWLEEARRIMYVSETHHARCETACLECLLTFDAQEAMRHGLLHRLSAYDVLEKLLNLRAGASKSAHTEAR